MLTPEIFQNLLLQWFDKSGRKHLPWQNPRTPYRVWLSEIMLQQTQVTTVIPYFNQFTQRFPDIQSLAKASLDQVLHQWAGLGYYARARNLHKTAQSIFNNNQEQFPKTLDELQSLPGIGRSTAGAIRSLAFNKPAAILDGNVKRVLCRLHGVSGWPGNLAVIKMLWTLTETYTSTEEPANYTQAIMDFGSLLCTRKQPKCNQCPFKSYCFAYAHQKVEQYPEPRPRQQLKTRSMQAFILINEQHDIFLEKREPVGIWGGLWSVPIYALTEDISAWCQKNYACTIKKIQAYPLVKHTFTHFHLALTPVICHVKLNQSNFIQDNANAGWFTQAALQEKGLAAPIKKILYSLDVSHHL